MRIIFFTLIFWGLFLGNANATLPANSLCGGQASPGLYACTDEPTLNGILFKAARVGTFVCTSGGAITVANTNWKITSIVLISLNTAGGTVTTVPAISNGTGGTNFIAQCATLDTSTYNYTVMN